MIIFVASTADVFEGIGQYDHKMEKRMTNNKLWTTIALIAAVFPSLMVGYEILMRESITTVVVYAAMVIIFFGTLIAAWRARPTPTA